MQNILHEGLSQLMFAPDELAALEKMLNTYIDELLIFNKRRRMVNTDDRDEIVVRHVLDCLAAYPFIKAHLPAGNAADSREDTAGSKEGEARSNEGAAGSKGGAAGSNECDTEGRGAVGAAGWFDAPLQDTPRCGTTRSWTSCQLERPCIADVGSGAGLPGIVLACALSQCDFVLIERMASRASFLEDAASMLYLKNVKVLAADAGGLKGAHFASIVTSRAYSPLDKESIEVYSGIAKEGGLIALYKTPKEAEATRETVKEQHIEYDITRIEVPFMKERQRCIVSWVNTREWGVGCRRYV